EQNLAGGIREYMGVEEFQTISREIREVFHHGDIAALIRLFDHHFEVNDFSFWHLFHDEQRRIITKLFSEAEQRIENFHRESYANHYQMMSALKKVGMPLPSVMQATVEFVVNQDVIRIMDDLPLNEDAFKNVKEEIKHWGIEIDKQLIGYRGSKNIARLSDRYAKNPIDSDAAQQMKLLLEKYNELGVSLNLWYSQNNIYEVGLEQFFIRKQLAE